MASLGMRGTVATRASDARVVRGGRSGLAQSLKAWDARSGCDTTHERDSE